MFKFFNKRKIFSTSDTSVRNHIQELFAENSIKYTIKTKDVYRKNTYDMVKMGSLGNLKVKYVYSFYVDSKDVEDAMRIISVSV